MTTTPKNATISSNAFTAGLRDGLAWDLDGFAECAEVAAALVAAYERGCRKGVLAKQSDRTGCGPSQ